MKFVLDYKFEERQVSTKIRTTTTVFVIMNNMQCPMLFGNHGIMYLYYYIVIQELKFTVYDWDGEKKDLAAHDYLGSTVTSVGEIVSAQFCKVRFS